MINLCFATVIMTLTFLIPFSAFLASLSILIHQFKIKSKNTKPLLYLYSNLAIWNLLVAFTISANSPKESHFYLMLLRPFLFFVPVTFLWFCLKISKVKSNKTMIIAIGYASLLTLASIFFYLTNSKIYL